MKPKTKKVREPKLDRCPFCSKKPKLGPATSTDGGDWLIRCTSSNHVVLVYGNTRRAVIRKWNGR